MDAKLMALMATAHPTADQIGWLSQDQIGGLSRYRAEWRSPESIKRALLAAGTKGFWALVLADSGCPMKGFWAMGINILSQSKRGWA